MVFTHSLNNTLGIDTKLSTTYISNYSHISKVVLRGVCSISGMFVVVFVMSITARPVLVPVMVMVVMPLFFRLGE